jgi:hypothetical protein
MSILIVVKPKLSPFRVTSLKPSDPIERVQSSKMHRENLSSF